MNSLNTIVSDDSSLPHSTRPISRLNIKSGFLNGAQKMLISQADALLELSSRLDRQFEDVVQLILSRHRGRVDGRRDRRRPGGSRPAVAPVA